MLHELAASHSLGPALVGRQIGFDELDLRRPRVVFRQNGADFFGALQRPQRAANRMALLQKLQDDMLGDKSGRSRDQNT